MTVVLVVDDSAVDRQVVGGLLKADASIHVEYASDGAEALEILKERLPDVIVSDLVMPRMDGLELLAAVRRRHWLVPTILMTSQGNEEVSVRALKMGAASYVPKAALAQELLETVHRVIGLSSQQKGHVRLMQRMTKSECSFELDNDSTLIPPLVRYLQTCASLTGLCDETERVRLGVAIEEALLNAVHHGNLEVSSDLRDPDIKVYYQAIEERRQQTPYMHRKVQVKATFSRSEGKFYIRDEGAGFDVNDMPDPTDPANLEKPGGRGILLMRFIMDDVRFNETGNEVVLIKRRPTDEEEPVSFENAAE